MPGLQHGPGKQAQVVRGITVRVEVIQLSAKRRLGAFNSKPLTGRWCRALDCRPPVGVRMLSAAVAVAALLGQLVTIASAETGGLAAHC